MSLKIPRKVYNFVYDSYYTYKLILTIVWSMGQDP